MRIFVSVSSADFNCTIQELKQDFHDGSVYATRDFNCTIQELKLGDSSSLRGRRGYFNCTIQELKQQTNQLGEYGRYHFNCTIQELKLVERSIVCPTFLISIAPYRN